MKEDAQSLMAALSVNLLTVNMLLSVFFLPGDSDYCGSATPAFFITTPGNMEALSGSCLKIPCSFKPYTVDGSSKTSGFWINSENSIFVSSNSVTGKSFTVKITGNLSQRDCSSEFSDLKTSHSGKYFFRMENPDKESDKGTACRDPLQITVRDSPWSPTIQPSAGLKDLKEKESFTISCSALTPCPHSPPELTWNLQQDSDRQTEKNTDGTLTTKIQQTITLSDTHDGNIIRCSVRYPVDEGKQNKTAKTEVTLSVSYAPKDTSASISPSGLVSAGSWVNLSCSSRAKPPISSFTWFKISSERPVQVSKEQVYSFRVTEGGEFYCVAANDLGNQTSSRIRLGSNGSPNSHLLWVAVLGGTIVFVLVCLVVFVCCFKFRRQTPPQTQSNIYVEFAAQTAASEKQEEELHYGDVTFLQRRPGASSVSDQDRGQQETVYDQVKVSKAENCSAQTADSPEDLYAQVKRK